MLRNHLRQARSRSNERPYWFAACVKEARAASPFAVADGQEYLCRILFTLLAALPSGSWSIIAIKSLFVTILRTG